MQPRRINLKPGLLAIALAGTFSLGAQAAGTNVTWDDIKNDDKTPGDVLSYGIGLKAQRHSPLKTVNTKNAFRPMPGASPNGFLA